MNPEASICPSGENATLFTHNACPFSVRSSSPSCTRHTSTVQSNNYYYARIANAQTSHDASSVCLVNARYTLVVEKRTIFDKFG